VRQVGYLQRLYRDARSTEHEKFTKNCAPSWLYLQAIIRPRTRCSVSLRQANVKTLRVTSLCVTIPQHTQLYQSRHNYIYTMDIVLKTQLMNYALKYTLTHNHSLNHCNVCVCCVTLHVSVIHLTIFRECSLYNAAFRLVASSLFYLGMWPYLL